MESHVVKSQAQMGIVHMAQRVTFRNTLITGRLQLFTPERRVITNDPWFINAIHRHTIDLKGQSTQYKTPRELTFSQ